MASRRCWYGLRPACSATVTTGCFHLAFAAPAGTSENFFGKIGGWLTEADLDVELIHALAPQASIVVVEAYDDSDTSMMAAVDYTQKLHPAAVSNSWGEAEFAAERSLDSSCPAAGAVCVFSSGDSGNYASCIAAGGTGCGGYPAADPGVLSRADPGLPMDWAMESCWQAARNAKAVLRRPLELKLAALVGVEDHPRDGAAADRHGHGQRPVGQLGVVMLAECDGDHPAGKSLQPARAGRLHPL
jgi:hypothetical protein